MGRDSWVSISVLFFRLQTEFASSSYNQIFEMSQEMWTESLNDKMEFVQEELKRPANGESRQASKENNKSSKKIADLDYWPLQEKNTPQRDVSEPIDGSLLVEKDSGHEQWTIQDEEQLVHLHNLKGNRWVEIARELNKSDNAVKNHYHSRFRKTLRKINKCVTDHLKGQAKPLKNSVISKIVQTAQGLYSPKEEWHHEQSEKAYSLKNQILSQSTLGQQQIGSQKIIQIKTLVSQIQEFIKELKTKNKTKVQDKTVSNKYKGKEIMSLLTQNSINLVPTDPDHQSRRSVTTTYYEEPKSPQVERSKKIYKRSYEEPRPNNRDNLFNSPLSQPERYPPFFIFNEGMMPLQPMFYPICHQQHFSQQNNIVFSGRQSSFSCYNPQKEVKQGLTNYPSMGHLELESNKNQIQTDKADTLKGFGTNSSLS